MAERSEEAIMPLTRDASGRLAVHAAGRSASASNQNVAVTSEVRVSVDQNGNLQAFVERTAARTVDSRTPKFIAAHDKNKRNIRMNGGTE